jgi:hypothetical protein
MKELKPQVVRDDYSQRSATQLAGSAAALVGYRIEISVLLNFGNIFWNCTEKFNNSR